MKRTETGKFEHLLESDRENSNGTVIARKKQYKQNHELTQLTWRRSRGHENSIWTLHTFRGRKIPNDELTLCDKISVTIPNEDDKGGNILHGGKEMRGRCES